MKIVSAADKVVFGGAELHWSEEYGAWMHLAGFDNGWYSLPIWTETYGSVYHAFPAGDRSAHVLSEDCPCRPVLDANGVFLHRSYDQRELFDTKRRSPS